MNIEQKLTQQQTTSKTIPTSQESEMYVIGAAMFLEGAVQKIFDKLRHWHFYFDQNKTIWKTITRMVRQDKAVTKDFLYLELHKKAYFDGEIEAGYLQQCIDQLGSGGLAAVKKNALVMHRELVFETWTRRQMIDLGATIQFWGLLPSGHTSKMLDVFEKRKQRIEKAYELAEEKDTLDDARFDPNGIIEKEDFVLNLEMDGHTYGIAEPGCIVSISGGSGARKTTALTAIISSAYRNDNPIGFKFQRRGKILFFDTEQPRKRFQHVQRRLFKMCGRSNTWDSYEAFTLREKSVQERIHEIDKKIREVQKKEPIAAIIIDGILDLVEDMNNLKECTAVIQRLMEWTSQTGAVLFPVLHDVHSSKKMGGHLGSFLERKQDAEINVTLAENPDYSNIFFRKTRGGRKPRSFEFTQNEEGWPVLVAPMVTISATGTDDDVPF